jgi:LuxR family transcriptional regulator, maltose regulon positive regulatory protein
VFWSTVVAALRSAGVEFRRVLPAPGRTGRAGHAFLLRLAAGLASQDPPVALMLLSFALEAGWMRPVLRSDPWLARAYRHVMAPDLATHRHPSAPAADPVLVEELTVRECEVLKLLAGLHTTAEVAGELYISLNTVKTHLKSIYRKLAANHRGEAVRRAKELHVI